MSFEKYVQERMEKNAFDMSMLTNAASQVGSTLSNAASQAGEVYNDLGGVSGMLKNTADYWTPKVNNTIASANSMFQESKPTLRRGLASLREKIIPKKVPAKPTGMKGLGGDPFPYAHSARAVKGMGGKPYTASMGETYGPASPPKFGPPAPKLAPVPENAYTKKLFKGIF